MLFFCSVCGGSISLLRIGCWLCSVCSCSSCWFRCNGSWCFKRFVTYHYLTTCYYFFPFYFHFAGGWLNVNVFHGAVGHHEFKIGCHCFRTFKNERIGKVFCNINVFDVCLFPKYICI